MAYTFNPFTGSFDNTPSTLKGDEAYSTLQTASGDWSTYDYVNSTFLPLSGGTLSGNLAIGGGPTTFFVGSSAVGINIETPNEALTVVGNVSATGTVIGSNLNVSSWDSVYSTVQAKSATEWDNALANQYTHANFFPLSGGVITGATRFNNNVTIFGNLSCSGTQTFANTIFTTTSALSVVHVGGGPAMWVGNNGSGDIASFYDIDQGVEIFHIGGNNGDFPNVGVKTSAPNKDFTVNGEISAFSTIWAKDNNSDQWASVYSTVQSNSAQWASNVDTGVRALTSNWQNTYNTVLANSATNWNNSLVNQYTHANFLPLSGGIITSNLFVLSALEVGSGQADFVITEGGNVGINTETPNEKLTVVGNISAVGNLFTQGQILSAGIDIITLMGTGGTVSSNVDTGVRALTSNWESTYTTVQSNSAQWASNVDTGVRALTSNWQNTYTTVQSNSAQWASNVDTGVRALTSNWESTYTTVAGNSAQWASNVDTGVRTLTSNWESTYTTVAGNSATNWNNSLVNQYVHTNFLPLTGGTITGNISAVGTHVFEVSATTTAVRITQTGTGEAIRVEDSSNPDSTPFIVGNDGRVYLGSTQTLYNANLIIERPYQTSSQVAGIYSRSNINNSNTVSVHGFQNVIVANTGNYTVQNVNGFLAEATNIRSVGVSATHLAGFYATSTLSGVGLNNYGFLSNLDQSNISGIRNYNFYADGTAPNYFGGNVGVRTTAPNQALTVSGNISATGNLFTQGQILSAGIDIITLMGTGGTVSSNVDTGVRALTSNWESTYTTVQSNSAQWASNVDTGVRALTSNWESTYTTVAGNSAQWASNVDTGVRALTSNWESTYTTVQSNSATNWNNSLANQYTHTNFLPLTGGTITGNISATGNLSVSSIALTNSIIENVNSVWSDTIDTLVIEVNGTKYRIALLPYS